MLRRFSPAGAFRRNPTYLHLNSPTWGFTEAMMRLCSLCFALASLTFATIGAAPAAEDPAPATAEKDVAKDSAIPDSAKPSVGSAKAKAEAAAKEAAEEYELQKLFADTIDQVER